MPRTAIKARLAVVGGTPCKRRNAERSFAHLTRRARQRKVSALLYALRRYPTCAAAYASPKPLSECAEPLTTISTGCWYPASLLDNIFSGQGTGRSKVDLQQQRCSESEKSGVANHVGDRC